MRMWIPGAKILAAHQDGTLLGGAKKVVWHTTENDPNYTSALAVARYLNSVGSQVHLVWNPNTGEMVQMIPANRGGRGLANRAGGVQTNNGGSIVFQIEVVGQAKNPWTENGPCKNLDVIVAFLRQLGIDNVWPAGDLKPYPASYGGSRSTSAWAKEGHFGHSQVPENDHGDPGDITQSKITGAGAPKPASSIPPVFTKPTSVVLNVGSRGPAVVRVQKIVGAVADGVYGPATKAKVAAWQKSKGLDADGIWGPASEKASKAIIIAKPTPPKPKPKLNSIYGKFPLPAGHFYGVNDGTNWSHSGVRGGNDKFWVSKIQRKVGASVDGVFGPGTKAKVVAWQKKNKIGADGKVGTGTWAKMLKV